ncbi:nickel-dependent hydrogenase large subunit [bacterium endosymbiont of Bathymodiolus sp. 5 South]|jgi:coenzyme F420-reducing hydrogenase alpha subunit|uniref:nickel-dependent hydrogenase large subunit n=1 Tax=bacterium endosymbiont of Bathymodiolus sp. 5 South TaxID=1181670 RepID=UPI0010AFCBFA|nr:nickel-dependent hydrogenase large subunit [bacterium endosymbiont of Bathymodiolus sp. 5 South]VVH56268.1 hypothetical protein BSPCLSOX_2852 [uncultured Gammaproteobacteria bacterium]SHN91517.1 hypothetical protein BCLUESOX_1912 [bacterium endosymbiont of Bathymodiolus sp. 5 South]VVH63770.1 hypothetical protein BSPWISOX_1350 [uncultured Gammaproteobacteria bacterium]VVM24079.1 hypothetical protein BSPWISOXPB_5958 [uncultured Gammaproteobacteria bacterium]VVM26408.1 hypothetical protein BS
MSIEGEITIKVITNSGVAKETLITSSRPLHIPQLFIDQPVQKVAETLDSLYQLCNTAHRFAFLRLLDKCKVISLSENEVLAYQLLLDLETIREHCFSISSKWRINDNQKINKNMIDLLATLKEINSTLFSVGNPLSLLDKTLQSFACIKNLVEKLKTQLTLTLIGEQFNAETVFSNIHNFDYWIKTQSSDCAIFLHNIQQSKFGDLGKVKTQFLPNITTAEITVLLNDDAFIAQPSHNGICYETTPYTRQINHPLIQQLSAKYDAGLLSRVATQLLEIFELMSRVKGNYTQIYSEDIHYNKVASIDATSAIVEVEAARGKLIHSLTVQGDQVKAYRILSPTQWNFHPQGILKQMIQALNFNNKQDLVNKITLLVNAIDPCVGYKIKVIDA